MDHGHHDHPAGTGRTRRLLLKLLGAGGLAGVAGVATAAQQASAAPAPTDTLVSYLAAKDVDAAVAFYRRAFSAVQTLRLTDATGTAFHATVTIGGAALMIGRENAGLGFHSPATVGGFSGYVIITVQNADTAFNQAVAAGATIVQAPADKPFGRRVACVLDPFGQYWQVAQLLQSVPADEVQRRYAA
jgi:PhnB protein